MYLTSSALRFSPIFSIVLLMGIIAFVACGDAPKTNKFSNRDLLDALDNHTEQLVFGSVGGPQIIITPELSARVLGASFTGGQGENLLWVDDTVYNGAYWNEKPYYWNPGGYRTWIAPEDLFFLDADDEWFVPAELDPAPYRVIEKNAFGATLEADVSLKTNIDKHYNVILRREISLLIDSPAKAGRLPGGVNYMGINLLHSLTNSSEEIIGVDLPYVCLWNLLQIEPSGTTLVPLVEGSDPQTAYREYFNPLGDRLKVANDIISVKIDGEYRSKIGVRAEAAKNGVAYIRDNNDDTGVLYVMLFPIDPEGIYVDKPWGVESDYGDAIELYNDDGEMGGFTEIECHGPAKELGSGETQSHLVVLHIFNGSIPQLIEIGSNLLDTDLSQAVFF